MQMAGDQLARAVGRMGMNFSYTQNGPEGFRFYGTRPDLPTTMDAVIEGARTSTLRKPHQLPAAARAGGQVLFSDRQGRTQLVDVTGRRIVDPSMKLELSQRELWTPDFLEWYMGRHGDEGGRMAQITYQLPGQSAQQQKIYAGIGSRKTPAQTLSLMRELGGAMEQKGYLLRSGGAHGADQAFEAGVRNPKHRAIYLPEDEFAGRRAGPGGYYDARRLPGYQEALKMVEHYHPNPAALKAMDARRPPGRVSVMDLMARNAMQVLGPNLDRPADTIVAWAPGGYEGRNPPKGFREGGTGQALRIARDHGIEIRNLANPATEERARRFLARMRG
jgi:hypothetical protein